MVQSKLEYERNSFCSLLFLTWSCFCFFARKNNGTLCLFTRHQCGNAFFCFVIHFQVQFLSFREGKRCKRHIVTSCQVVVSGLSCNSKKTSAACCKNSTRWHFSDIEVATPQPVQCCWGRGIIHTIHGAGIFTYIWLMFMVNVNISYIDFMGNETI